MATEFLLSAIDLTKSKAVDVQSTSVCFAMTLDRAVDSINLVSSTMMHLLLWNLSLNTSLLLAHTARQVNRVNFW